MVKRRGDVLTFAILGLLMESPLHGYELRKRLTGVLGPFRAISYGSLYPALRSLQGRGLIAESAPKPIPTVTTKRARTVYEITSAGTQHFSSLVANPGPDAWDDEPFAAHLAFFSRTPREIRLRILEGRRARLQERMAMLRESFRHTSQRLDHYAKRMHEHGLETVESEVRWLEELIELERGQ
jgi:DNA-binding PadR family transcriptional regulator